LFFDAAIRLGILGLSLGGESELPDRERAARCAVVET